MELKYLADDAVFQRGRNNYFAQKLRCFCWDVLSNMMVKAEVKNKRNPVKGKE